MLAITITAAFTACSSGSSTHPKPSASSTANVSSTATGGTRSPVTIPSVIGTTAIFAEEQMASAGLGHVSETKRFNIKYPLNEVTGTSPPVGQKVLAGSAVTIVVSAGIGVCINCASSRVSRKMPNVCGLTFQAANTMLVEDDITLSSPPISVPSAKPAGEIIGSVPPAGMVFIVYGSSAAQEAFVTVSSGHSTPSASPSPADARNTC